MNFLNKNLFGNYFGKIGNFESDPESFTSEISSKCQLWYFVRIPVLVPGSPLQDCRANSPERESCSLSQPCRKRHLDVIWRIVFKIEIQTRIHQSLVQWKVMARICECQCSFTICNLFCQEEKQVSNRGPFVYEAYTKPEKAKVIAASGWVSLLQTQ